MGLHLASTYDRIADDMISPISKPHYFFLEINLEYARFLFETL